MKITLKRTEDQVALVKALASKNREEAFQAREALAAFIGPVLDEVINQAPTLSNKFSSFGFNRDDSPSIPLDLYADINAEDYISVWSQTMPGGLPTNHVTPPQAELKFTTYNYDTAYSFDEKFARQSRLDVVSKTFTRMVQTILLAQEKTSATLILQALANAETNGKKHVLRSATSDRFVLADLNKLFTRIKRINTAWTGGTPDSRQGRGITDLIVSPEIVEEIRNMAYNPVNVKGAVNAGTPTDGSAIPASDELRNQIYNSAGIPEFFGVSIMEINELGVGQKWNTIFDSLAGSTTYDAHYVPGGSAAAFNGSNEELLLGLDLSRESLIKAVAQDEETGGELTVSPDDQYVSRQRKIGFYGMLEEGRIVLDSRTIVGLIV